MALIEHPYQQLPLAFTKRPIEQIIGSNLLRTGIILLYNYYNYLYSVGIV